MGFITKFWKEHGTLTILVILFVGALGGIANCRSMQAQRDAAYEVANRQMVLGRELGVIQGKQDAALRRLEEEALAADAVDAQTLEDLYEQGAADGSSANILNALIDAGELP